MKRIVFFVLLLVFVMNSLTGCIIIPQYKHFKIDADSVSSIEIYDLCKVDTYESYFLETEDVDYTIPEEKASDFLKDLSDIRFSDHILIILAAVDPSFSYDTWTVRINYADGSFELISCDGYGQSFDENGTKIDSHHYGCDNDEWNEFLKKYIPKEIFSHAHTTESLRAEE